MSNVVKQGQCLIDKVVQLTGNFENVLAIALKNDLSVTDSLPADSERVRGKYVIGLKIQTVSQTNKRVVEFFNKKNEPATALTQEELAPVEGLGIGTMEIGSTFIVG